MQKIPHIITERVDDMPLRLEQMQRLGLPTWCDTPCPTHGPWTGLSLGWVSTIWLSAMVSRGDHRRVPVEPWGAQRLWTLGGTTGPAGTRVDGTADRRASVWRRVRNAERWSACAAALQPPTVRGEARATARGPVESPSARVEATGNDHGLCQGGHRKEERPALPQGTVRPAVVAP